MAPTKKKGKVSPATKSLRKSKSARDAKKAYDTAYNKKPGQSKKRSESNKKRREATKAGKDIKGKDYDHKQKKFIKSESNRGQADGNTRKKGVKRGTYKKRR